MKIKACGQLGVLGVIAKNNKETLNKKQRA